MLSDPFGGVDLPGELWPCLSRRHDLAQLIESEPLLVVANPKLLAECLQRSKLRMRCSQAVLAALRTAGMSYTLKASIEFHASFSCRGVLDSISVCSRRAGKLYRVALHLHPCALFSFGGESAAWDWLHCSYPNDRTSSGTIMWLRLRASGARRHSYVFQNGQFLGEGLLGGDLSRGPSLKLDKLS